MGVLSNVKLRVPIILSSAFWGVLCGIVSDFTFLLCSFVLFQCKQKINKCEYCHILGLLKYVYVFLTVSVQEKMWPALKPADILIGLLLIGLVLVPVKRTSPNTPEGGMHASCFALS